MNDFEVSDCDGGIQTDSEDQDNDQDKKDFRKMVKN